MRLIRPRRLLPLMVLLTFFAAACTPAATETIVDADEPDSVSVPTETAQTGSEPVPNTEETTADEPTATTGFTEDLSAAPCEDPFEGISIRFNKNVWPNTDFCKYSIDYSEILSGGPPPDGIAPVDNPKFEGFEEGDDWLDDSSPVLAFEWNGDARAYPLGILIQHEIVNDVVGGQPVALTYCPLCNATIAFNRVLTDGTTLDFGTSGNLRKSDLVMWDRQTFSWWQQFTGTAIVGELTGTQLEFLPSQIISWAEFKASKPEGQILSRDTGHFRDYNRSPYINYDNLGNTRPFLFDGTVDERLPAMERVVALEIGDFSIAYPFSSLSDAGAANDTVEGESIAVFWLAGTVSAFFDASEGTQRNIGSTAVFNPIVDGQTLTFSAVEGGFEDIETGSIWNIFGEAIDGPLAGTKLEQLVSAEHFWFAWAAFKPDTAVWGQ